MGIAIGATFTGCVFLIALLPLPGPGLGPSSLLLYVPFVPLLVLVPDCDLDPSFGVFRSGGVFLHVVLAKSSSTSVSGGSSDRDVRVRDERDSEET